MPEFFRNFFRKEQSPTKIDEETPKQPVLLERTSLPERERRRSPFETAEEGILESYEKKESRPLEGGTNKVVFVQLRDDGSGVFKPKNGEREDPRLHIQAGTYFKRERAAYLVSQFLGFDLVPPTVIREIDGEIGSMQQFISDFKTGREVSPYKLVDDVLRKSFLKLWIFDYIIYNSDRNGGGFLVNDSGGEKMYAIDNAMSFCNDNPRHYEEFEEYWNLPIPPEVAEGIEKFLSWKEGREICEDLLRELLGPDEVEACMRRIEKVVRIIRKHGMIPRSSSWELTF